MEINSQKGSVLTVVLIIIIVGVLGLYVVAITNFNSAKKVEQETEFTETLAVEEEIDLCQNECPVFGLQQCIDEQDFHICSHDASKCLIWSSDISCPVETKCLGGVCTIETVEESTEEPIEDSSQCTSGLCCDFNTRTFKTFNYICHSKAATEYRCPWGTDEGDDVGVRYQDRYCSGQSNNCDGQSKWRDWEIYENCSIDQTCGDRECVDIEICQSECSTSGLKQCSGNGYKICEDNNGDGCLEWSPVTSCGSGKICSDGECIDEPEECESHNYKQCYDSDVYWYDSCSQREDKYEECGSDEWTSSYRCADNMIQRQKVLRSCSGSDCEEDYKWFDELDCSTQNQICFEGGCIDDVPQCSDECSYNGQRSCFGTIGYKTCGYYDIDDCLELGSLVDCPNNSVCENGECIQQECSDGTAYEECSENKPQYCDNGSLINKASLCGCPYGYEVVGNNCEKIPQDGLIIIRDNSEGKSYAEQIAQQKDWGFISLSSSDTSYIKNEVLDFYDENNNEFLLIIGDFSEIPLKDTHSIRFGQNVYITDPQLYGDINDDGYVDLSVGRIPFSSESSLQKYFTNLQVLGSNLYIENYAFGDLGDEENLPYDVFTSKAYNAAYCLKKQLPQLQSLRFRSLNQLISDYTNSSVAVMNSHGSWSTFMVETREEYINSQYHSVGINELCGSNQNCFPNRPIFIHFACLNARQLGVDLLKRGASAFVGHYNTAGNTPKGFLSQLSSGDNIGAVVKNQVNKKVSRNYAMYLYVSSDGSIKQENIDIVNEGVDMLDDYGMILFGDPSLSMNLQRNNADNITVQQNTSDRKIIITLENDIDFLLDPVYGEDYYGIVCYNSDHVENLSFMNQTTWEEGYNSSHDVSIVAPINSPVNQINSFRILVNGQVDSDYNESIIYYYFKGEDQYYLYLRFDLPSVPSEHEMKIELFY